MLIPSKCLSFNFFGCPLPYEIKSFRRFFPWISQIGYPSPGCEANPPTENQQLTKHIKRMQKQSWIIIIYKMYHII